MDSLKLVTSGLFDARSLYQLFLFFFCRKNETSHLAIYATSDERYLDVNEEQNDVNEEQTQAFPIVIN